MIVSRISIFVRKYLFLCLATALFAGAFTLLATPKADAWTSLGCKFDGTDPTIYYRFVDTNDRTKISIFAAQRNWNRSDVPGRFAIDTPRHDSNVDIFDGKYISRNHWAWVSWTCDSDGTFKKNEVDLTRNFATTALGDLTSNELAIVMVHELGHTYGLNHSKHTCTGAGPAVMVQGRGKFACAGTSPWHDDTSGVRTIY